MATARPVQSSARLFPLHSRQEQPPTSFSPVPMKPPVGPPAMAPPAVDPAPVGSPLTAPPPVDPAPVPPPVVAITPPPGGIEASGTARSSATLQPSAALETVNIS